VAKAPIAVKAIPACNITYIDGDDMKAKVNGYLEVLFKADPKSVGGALPEDDFYFNR
jgi:NitT/TauT family transport system substrate-binding protein